MKNFIVIPLLALLCTACRTTQIEQTAHYQDSIRTVITYDTLRITIADTLHLDATAQWEQLTTTHIVFADSGGYYNTTTGEMHAVRSIQRNDRQQRQDRLIASYQQTIEQDRLHIERLETHIAQLKQQLTHRQNTQDITPKANGWHRFLVAYFFLTLAAAILIAAIWLIKTFYFHR